MATFIIVLMSTTFFVSSLVIYAAFVTNNRSEAHLNSVIVQREMALVRISHVPMPYKLEQYPHRHSV